MGCILSLFVKEKDEYILTQQQMQAPCCRVEVD